MPSIRNMSFDQFAEKFTGDTEHILEFVGNLGHGRNEKRSLQVYALRKLVEKHARKAGIDLGQQGELSSFFLPLIMADSEERNSELSDYQRVAGDDAETIEHNNDEVVELNLIEE